MAIDRRPRAPERGIQLSGRLDSPPTARTVALLLLPIVLVALVAVARANLVTARPTLLGLTAGAEDATPEQLTAAAADSLETTVAPGGAGYTFEIVQRSTMRQRDGGPPIAVEATDGRAEPTVVVEHPLATYLESGVVTPDGFWAEIRRGSDDPSAEPDFDAAPMEMAALVRDGVTWRDDGAGWYETGEPPGLGLDPASAALLPRMLREATATRETPTDGSDEARALEATTKAADVPGIIAVDLGDSTEILEPAALAFDDQGRLVQVTIVARNTRLEDFDLIVETTIRLAYPAVVPDLPKPEPVWVEPAPDPDGETES